MGTKIKRYVILTPFDQAEVVAGIASLQHLDVAVVPTSSGALVVRELPVPQYDEWDIRNILGPDDADLEELAASGEPADNAPAVAAFFSRLSKYGVVLLDVNLDDGDGFDAGVAGTVRAWRYQAGEPGEEISAGLLLNSAEPLLEKIILGQEKPEDHGGIFARDVTPTMLTKLAARRRSASGGKKGREEQSDDSDSIDSSGDGPQEASEPAEANNPQTEREEDD
ncbi:hypothetical protein [Actinobaculum sp. 313]|uniref:hypothetical protein n=1 Tax=Actinobaculum sp. 313 TaxID=2495645 RepID=UPI000D529231|nr:hypothetical protein [Actinobaculum sp. 313]AWE42314.1 hypothetical protein DDD63_05615 [Actinobaculum sp. 313]